MQQTPPGWYPDGQGSTRYWDGSGWAVAPPRPEGGGAFPNSYATSPLPAVSPAPGKSKPWYQHKGFIIPAAIVGVLIVLGAIGSAVSPKKTVSNNAEPGQSSSARTTGATGSPVTSAVPSTTAARTSPTRAAPVPPKTKADSDGSFAMPDEVGSVLQTAQDDIQRVSGDPVFVSHSHDLLGSRFQVLDRNWKVCDQNIAPGQKVSAVGHIDFGVVKVEEECP
jgi:hypothetical protein